MNRHLLPVGKVDRTGLRRWFHEQYGYRPGWYTLAEAIDQGLPCEPHPLTGRPMFDLQSVADWVATRSLGSIRQTPSKDTEAP